MSLDDAKPEPPKITNARKNKGRKGRNRRDAEGLTFGERKFAMEYVQCGDGQKAAIAAGYSKPTAKFIAQKILTRPHVLAFIDQHLTKIEKRYAIDAATILKELARVSLADPRNLFDADGNVKPVTEWSADDAACISQVEIVKRNVFAGDGKMDTIMKIRLWDKPKSLEILAKHLGLLTERLEIRGDAELVDRLTAARKRIAVVVEQ